MSPLHKSTSPFLFLINLRVLWCLLSSCSTSKTVSSSPTSVPKEPLVLSSFGFTRFSLHPMSSRSIYGHRRFHTGPDFKVDKENEYINCSYMPHITPSLSPQWYSISVVSRIKSFYYLFYWMWFRHSHKTLHLSCQGREFGVINYLNCTLVQCTIAHSSDLVHLYTMHNCILIRPSSKYINVHRNSILRSELRSTPRVCNLV